MKITTISSGDRFSLKRSIDAGTEEQRKTVRSIIEDVRRHGNQAVKAYTEKFDGISLDDTRVTEEEIKQAYSLLDDRLLQVIRQAIRNIQEYHERQLQSSWFYHRKDGTMLGQKITALDSAGVYVPGGTAAYPSSVLMNVIPALTAGVERIVLVTPPGKDGQLSPGVLAAASELGIKEIYKMGGAQAIAALAYGTETIESVDKITGPGNIYVALAKREVFGDVDIDMIAGPSEIVVLADDTAVPKEIAADLLSQAEHDKLSSSVLVTDSAALAQAVQSEVNEQLDTLPRKAIAEASIREYGHIYVAESMDEAVEAVNALAPEHLEIITKSPEALIGGIKHAGAIFLGRYSPEPVGDYFAGPNHVLPTNGTARFSSPLNVTDFQKKSSIISYSQKAFEEQAESVAAFARLEGLEAHARSIEARGRRNSK
ncbi:histidinol dehydrogenase [Bacillus atrophaeus]|uniref:Histidinol dehydrogenase n=1 Tax=Bacillus atrophaeus (strain 1942) TaxID=720555 RepID=A0ABM5M1R1_BACA1|nr:histidinol dehydrogenase [Bacillus atrophaeus]AMR61316.1 histidinol dehydrogenase [Bacillus subtilis subsp. globigii]ADP33991.1 histidinol dehydrogenase [Bacillus atrophaeus 1942]AIK46698.1 histidinol dehydrogenase [Bacillus atrophaeus subsp. globigii]EIM10993.1 bifunctional histidinal dehydrogenase/ histidinol dehydrogenase [Bacillus atrophaeus C89]KFK83098.1 histidinol dehydrogenase [Bacillus atrophaeus]